VETVNHSEAIMALGRAITATPRPEPTLETQSQPHASKPEQQPSGVQPKALASVDRVIILDPAGALPLKKRPGSCHRLVNLRQESKSISHWLLDSARAQPLGAFLHHADNMNLARDALDSLPSMPSVLITSPSEAAYHPTARDSVHGSKIASAVKTRVRQNPLIHNLLTDRPIYSSSLPVQRLYAGAAAASRSKEEPIRATLVKRGLPLTMYPDPMAKPWTRPKMGSARPRLTDPQVDLERLTYLINDSFGRTLDVGHYLARVDKNLAGIVIAGNYEGCAILTWEEAVDPVSGKSTMVPYLDKFAVLRSSQGTSGVADFVFNALVQDCFPEGLCWRSRKTNPVNKWYFERSTGFLDLQGTEWTMFWTSPNIRCGSPTLKEFEHACRNIEPSWKS
jgi:amino-acid N-acetyltransferase